LEIRVEKFVKKEAYKIEIHLNAPKEKLLAGEDDHTVMEAYDLALDKLVIQLRKKKDRK
jgi:ribosomal subunit interface protein